MKISELENNLRGAPETTARVSAVQHDGVMRAVRLAGSAETNPGNSRARPAWGMALAATAMLVVYVTQTPQPGLPAPTESQASPSSVSLSVLGDRLKAISTESALPEKELELEIQRLKSDLKRFGLKS